MARIWISDGDIHEGIKEPKVLPYLPNSSFLLVLHLHLHLPYLPNSSFLLVLHLHLHLPYLQLVLHFHLFNAKVVGMVAYK